MPTVIAARYRQVIARIFNIIFTFCKRVVQRKSTFRLLEAEGFFILKEEFLCQEKFMFWTLP